MKSKNRLTVALACAMLFVFCGGCLGTSQPFKEGMSAAIPVVVQATTKYADADADTAHATAVKSNLEPLSNSVAVKKSITLAGVQAAWEPVKPDFIAYFSADPRITGNPPLLKDRMDLANRIDSNIAAEKARQAKWFAK